MRSTWATKPPAQVRYLFTHVGGKNRGANLLAAEGIGGSKSPDVITLRTRPYR